MFIIAGLGNPGRQYAGTRHNMGFSALARLSDKYNIGVDREEHKAITGRGIIGGKKVLLCEPLTFMNLSGDSISELVNFYKIDVKKELIVIYDDIDLEPGKIRIRKKGSAGGHNGMKSIINRLGTQEFTRIRLGVGEKPAGWDLADHVLSRFSDDLKPVIDKELDEACDAVSVVLEEGPDAAMNRFN